MPNSGRPRKSQEELELNGSGNQKVDQIETGALKNPSMPPSILKPDAQRMWNQLIPTIEAGEADRMTICILCALYAKFFDETVYGDDTPEGIRGQPKVSEESRERITKQIMDISDKFGMNPLARSRSGINKKTMGVKQRS